MPSNQKPKIESAKFTYSPYEKAFEKQIKTIEDHGEKRVKAIKDNKKQLTNDKQIIIKMNCRFQRREIFKNIYNERLDKVEELTKNISYNDLTFIVESSGNETNFTKTDDSMTFLNNIKESEMKLQEAKKIQEDFNENLKKHEKEIKVKIKKKCWEILLSFLMEKMRLSNL